ncbi:enoyl-CoA hydratase/isomerase family protein [Streptomyces sp. VRA16 Mangrove soil]|uniref:enoyl-CoA hydratase/isomerase family protein n=1 Tax=Streptomyces sp. VRA16 Mangrove soil TaxID=2817434 RepID=UPI001A9EEB19|nr:enoyl-CoA hydratase/isomerase family protein [Streptomyces sp. VRA16 Mangrove soil]MBO1334337.1 enoyl-CoA hydratase/isomerase family protein [Streptomyces sp. VRA16 Mangrove soil]
MSNTTTTDRHAPVRAEQRSPGYWRVTFDNPPLNLYDPEVETALATVVDQLETDPEVKVVVFDSALPEFFMAHLNLGRVAEFGEGMPTWFDIVSRLGNAPFITVGSLRGRARGIGNEFLLALDVRFASREKAVLSQLEIGTGIIPGCGGIQRLLRLTGRSRALEIITSGEDFDADTAASYGWINRAVPDAELDAVVDRFARRIASFDTEALRAVKEIVNEDAPQVETADVAATHRRFAALLARESVQERLRQSAKAAPEVIYDLELHMGERLGARS